MYKKNVKLTFENLNQLFLSEFASLSASCAKNEKITTHDATPCNTSLAASCVSNGSWRPSPSCLTVLLYGQVRVSRTQWVVRISRTQRVIWCHECMLQWVAVCCSGTHVCHELRDLSGFNELNESSKFHEYIESFYMCHGLNESCEYHELNMSPGFHNLNESAKCHECMLQCVCSELQWQVCVSRTLWVIWTSRTQWII